MAKINRKRLLSLLSSINFIVLLVVGGLYMTQNFKPFKLWYYHQRNVEYVEAKYEKPYLEWLEESKAKCIADATKLPTNNPHKNNWLDSFATDADISNQISKLCEQGYSELLLTKNEVLAAYIKHMAINILMFVAIAAALSIFFGILLVHWLPMSIGKFARWLTANNDANT